MLLVTPVLHTHAFYIHAVLFSPVISSADPPGSDWDESKDACSVKVVVMNVLANGCRLSNRKTSKISFQLESGFAAPQFMEIQYYSSVFSALVPPTPDKLCR